MHSFEMIVYICQTDFGANRCLLAIHPAAGCRQVCSSYSPVSRLQPLTHSLQLRAPVLLHVIYMIYRRDNSTVLSQPFPRYCSIHPVLQCLEEYGQQCMTQQYMDRNCRDYLVEHIMMPKIFQRYISKVSSHANDPPKNECRTWYTGIGLSLQMLSLETMVSAGWSEHSA